MKKNINFFSDQLFYVVEQSDKQKRYPAYPK